MSDGLLSRPAGGIAPGAAHWLRLAAAPTFATLALLGGVGGEAACGYGGSGMTVMYGLMAAFHLPPWLALCHRSA